MDRELLKAAREGETQSLLRLLRDHPDILARGASTSADDTALQIAAMHGHFGFVQELISYMGEKSTNYVQELNKDGFSAVHLASANGHKEIVELLNISSQIVNLEGIDRMTPLHCACVKGRAAIVRHFLEACDNLDAVVSQRTVRGENALHLAVKNNQFGALQILVEKIKQENLTELLNFKDGEGNTILHLAAARRNRQIIELLLQCNNSNPRILQVNALNNSSLTALDVVPSDSGSNDIGILLINGGAERTRPSNSNQSKVEEYDGSYGKKLRSELLVVVTLLATTTYQAVLSPPDGMPSDLVLFVPFVVFNSLGFFTSLIIIMDVARYYPSVLGLHTPMVLGLRTAIIGVAITYIIVVMSVTTNYYLSKIFLLVLLLMPPSILWVLCKIRNCCGRNRNRSRVPRRHGSQSESPWRVTTWPQES